MQIRREWYVMLHGRGSTLHTLYYYIYIHILFIIYIYTPPPAISIWCGTCCPKEHMLVFSILEKNLFKVFAGVFLHVSGSNMAVFKER